MKITSMTCISLGLIHLFIIPYAYSSQNLNIEERLSQLELRLQKAESRAALAEQQNAQLVSQLKQTEQESQQAIKTVEGLEARTQRIEKITPMKMTILSCMVMRVPA